MATQGLQSADRKVSAGRVFERAFSTIRHNPGVTLGLALLFGAVPGVLMSYIMNFARPDSLTGPQARGFIAFGILGFLFSLVIAAFVQAVLTKATVAQGEGRQASFAECAQGAVAVALPLIALSILLAIAVGLGFMLLIVPGVMLYVMWSVAAPALVEERRGVIGSFGRSRQLTKGARWTIFGILVVMVIMYYLLLALAAAVGLGTLNPEAMTGKLPIGYLAVNLIVGLLANVVWGTVQASLYVELRDWKDGPMGEKLEEVFA